MNMDILNLMEAIRSGEEHFSYLLRKRKKKKKKKMRRRNVDIVSDDPMDTSEQEYFIEILHKDELKQYNEYKRYLIIFFICQTPLTVYWKQLRKQYPACCLLSLLSIILTVSSIHFKVADLKKNVSTNSVIQRLIDEKVFYVVNGIICTRLLLTVIKKSDAIWQMFFLLPVADFAIGLCLVYWHRSILGEIKNLESLVYKYKNN